MKYTVELTDEQIAAILTCFLVFLEFEYEYKKRAIMEGSLKELFGSLNAHNEMMAIIEMFDKLKPN